MATQDTIQWEECAPLLFPTTGGPCLTTVGLLSFTLSGLFSIGPHNFHHLQPIDFEYEGHRLRRAPKSNTLEITMPSGETYRFRYFSNSRTWAEVRIYEGPASAWPHIERLFRDMLEEHGPALGTVGIFLGSANAIYCGTLFVLIPRVLWAAAPHLVVLFFALAVSRSLYSSHWGELSASKADEAIVAAYFFPIGFAALTAFQVLVAAGKHRRLFSGRTWRSVGKRLLCLAAATCAAFCLYIQDVPVRKETFVTAWDRVVQGAPKEFREESASRSSL